MSRKEKALNLTILPSKTEALSFSIASGLGIGLIPGAPGTYGSILAVVLAGLLAEVAPWPWVLPLATMCAGWAGIWSATRIARARGMKDPQFVVIDEITGQWLTLCVIWPFSWRYALAGLVLFRLFDIVKPFPARRAELLEEGWGIMSDDVVAALYAMLALWVLSRW